MLNIFKCFSAHSEKPDSAEKDTSESTKTHPNTLPAFQQNKENDPEGLANLKIIPKTKLTELQYKSFVSKLCSDLHYAKILKCPDDSYWEDKKFLLKEKEKCSSKQKFLFVNLNECLIHEVDKTVQAEVSFSLNNRQYRFNVRPKCYEFLERVSHYYSVYAFTSSTKEESQPILIYLNYNKKVILDLLHKKHCMVTLDGVFIKDLRIVKNRHLKDIVILDHDVSAFAFQIDNGVPILKFQSNKRDNQLLEKAKYLIELSTAPDVRTFNRSNLNLEKLSTFSEDQILKVMHQNQ